MKKTTLFLALFAFSQLKTFAQDPQWIWAKNDGGINGDFAQSISSDASGNIFVTGYFSGPSITFDSITLNNTDSNFYDLFLVKYNAVGNVIWAKAAGGTSVDYATSVSADIFGNVYVAGYFHSASIIFDLDTLLNTAWGNDIFIAKYDPDGNVLWAKSYGGTNPYDDFASSVKTDASGNVYLTGNFGCNSIIFGAYTLTNSNTNNTPDVFVVKYDTNGNVLWAKSAGGANNDNATSASTDNSGNLFVAGNFYSPSIIFGSTTLNNTGSGDMFIVKYGTSGNVLWAKSAGGASSDGAISASPDTSGNVFVTGNFTSPSIIFGSTTLNNAGGSNEDMFIVKYDISGNVLWANSAGGTGFDRATSVSTYGSSDVIVAGYFNGPSMTFGTNTLTWMGGNRIFVVKYDQNGIVQWVQSTTGTTSGEANSVCTDAVGNIFITGSFGSQFAAFGSTTLNNITNANTSADIFLAKLRECTLAQPIISASGPTTFCDWDSITLTSSPAATYLWCNGATTQSITINYLPGNCSVSVTDVNGCNSSSTPISLNVIPVYGFTYSINNMSVTYTIDFTDESFCANNGFVWDYGNGTQNTLALNPTWTYSTAGVYTACLNCGNTPAQCIPCFNITVPGNTGMLEVNNETEYMIYPNPTNGKFQLFNTEDQKASVKIYNTIGECIYKSESGNSELDLSKHPKGIYSIVINTLYNSYNKKIIIQ